MFLFSGERATANCTFGLSLRLIFVCLFVGLVANNQAHPAGHNKTTTTTTIMAQSRCTIALACTIVGLVSMTMSMAANGIVAAQASHDGTEQQQQQVDQPLATTNNALVRRRWLVALDFDWKTFIFHACLEWVLFGWPIELTFAWVLGCHPSTHNHKHELNSNLNGEPCVSIGYWLVGWCFDWKFHLAVACQHKQPIHVQLVRVYLPLASLWT